MGDESAEMSIQRGQSRMRAQLTDTQATTLEESFDKDCQSCLNNVRGQSLPGVGIVDVEVTTIPDADAQGDSENGIEDNDEENTRMSI